MIVYFHIANSHVNISPAPLEGQEASPNALPSELAEEVETQLKAEKLGPSNFIALVNSAMIFKVDTHQAEMAAEA